jgi:hypothetical protein
MNSKQQRQKLLLKVFGYIFLAVWVLSLSVLWYHYADTRPTTPHPETGNIYELNTHGSRVYLTYEDCVRLYGAMAIGFGGQLTILAVRLRRKGWVY